MKKEEIIAFYEKDVKGCSDAQLFAILRGGIKARKAIKDVLVELANDELVARGHQLPMLSALFRI